MLTSIISLYIASSVPPTITQDDLNKMELNLPTTIVKELGPVKKSEFISPIVDAKGSIAVDIDSQTILFEKNAHERMPIASITKLMTALIILEENELNEIVTVSANAAGTEGSSMYLHSGERIALENLLYGIIINSANDAAVALAEHNAGTVNAFVEKMNEKAKKLGLINTHYSNPIGLDNPENYSSAYDIAKLGIHVYQDKFIKHAAKQQEFEVKSEDKSITHHLSSTNDLLDSYLNVKGLKTGRTDAAGLCLAAVAENDNEEEIITVVLNSPARFTESKIIIDWVFRAFDWP